MNTGIVIRVNNQRQLNLPLEIQSQLQPGDKYKVIVTENSIVLKKINNQDVDLDEFIQGLDELAPDPNQPTRQEISDIVKDVRREIWHNK